MRAGLAWPAEGEGPVALRWPGLAALPSEADPRPGHHGGRGGRRSGTVTPTDTSSAARARPDSGCWQRHARHGLPSPRVPAHPHPTSAPRVPAHPHALADHGSPLPVPALPGHAPWGSASHGCPDPAVTTPRVGEGPRVPPPLPGMPPVSSSCFALAGSTTGPAPHTADASCACLAPRPGPGLSSATQTDSGSL